MIEQQPPLEFLKQYTDGVARVGGVVVERFAKINEGVGVPA
jgi:hypothetical protein